MASSSWGVLDRWVPTALIKVMFSFGTWSSSDNTIGSTLSLGMARVRSGKMMATEVSTVASSRNGGASTGC